MTPRQAPPGAVYHAETKQLGELELILSTDAVTLLPRLDIVENSARDLLHMPLLV